MAKSFLGFTSLAYFAALRDTAWSVHGLIRAFYRHGLLYAPLTGLGTMP